MAIEELEGRWQYCEGDRDITADFTAERDADHVRAWNQDICLLAVNRTTRGLWAIDTSDVFRLNATTLRMRFGTPAEAVEYVAGRSEVRVTFS